ncbi:hypothetical protein AJ80_07420 [Polytolypa hystricis UAMH7299]|uniref:Uncharacterized protein n=1 Tax=Polytolypa hystricis (strain UAMH7299) TaxID=1447883 RepID=A0A2B7XPA8_POLH7|nr:hypothetical protein AJ80_07420 [Polytolypa hystricis UAMH7299]
MTDCLSHLCLLHISALDRDVAGNSHPLHLAAREGHLDVVKLLLDSGAEKDRPGFNDLTPLGLSLNVAYPARAAPNQLETMKLLVEYGADINKSYLLFDAVSLRDQSIIKYLLDHGGSINSRNPGDYSLLGHAAGSTDYKTVEFLLQNGAVLENPVDGCPNPALSSAAEKEKLDTQPLLFAHADDNTRSKYGEAIVVAAGAGHLEAVKVLLASGVDLESPGEMGQRALHAACASTVPLPEMVAY